MTSLTKTAKVKKNIQVSAETLPTPTPTLLPADEPTPQPKAEQTPAVKATPKPQKRLTPSNNLPVLNGQTLLNLINGYRISKGLPRWIASSELCAMAEGRADFLMADNMAAYRESQNGAHAGFQDLLRKYSGMALGENLAGNVTSEQIILNSWLNSPPHREILEWTVKDGHSIEKACAAVRVKNYGTLSVLLAGDK